MLIPKIQIPLCILVLIGFAGSLMAKEQAAMPATTSAPTMVSGSAKSADITAVTADATILARAKEATTKKFPNADTVWLDQSARIVYRKDGTYVERDDNYKKVLTEKGRATSLTATSGYNTFYGNFKVLKIEIIKPNGSVVTLDPKQQTSEMIDNTQMASNIYDPHDKLVTISFPGIEVGDVVHWTTEDVERAVPMPDEFFDREVFEDAAPIMRASVTITGPAALPLKRVALLNEIPHTITHTEIKHGGLITNTWVGENIPQYFPEPGMPSIGSCGQRLLVSTAPDWQTISRWYWDISKPHLLKITPAMREKVKELTKNAKTREEKMRSIFDFVSQDIRYMGITTETMSPGFEPHDVNITFNDRFGVCRDKAGLLVALLRAGGFDAYPVLINVGSKLDKEAPLLEFNHAITAVRNPDKTFTLMDSTNENTRDLFPSYLQDRSYLVATPEGESLRVSPIRPATDNLVNAQTNATVSDDGTLTGETTLQFSGISDVAYRGMFSEKKPDDIRRLFDSVVKARIPGASLTELEISPKNVRDTSKPLTVSFKFKSPDYLAANHGDVFLNPPFVGSGLGLPARILAKYTGLEKRRFPILIGFTSGVKEHFTLTLPKTMGKPEALPKATDEHNAAMLYHRSLAFANGQLTGDFNLQILQPEIPAAAYPQLKATIADAEYAARQLPIFAVSDTTQTAADIQTLESQTSYAIKDAHTWTATQTVREKVLTYAGKKDNSELHLSYNPIWTTLKLNYARVVLADGTVKNVQPQEQNLMDAAWVASAPRYPAGKELVISLPGVEVGSTIEYSYTAENKDHPFFSLDNSFAGFNPVDRDTLTIVSPETLPLAIKDNADLKSTVANHERTLTATHSYAAIPNEPDLAPAWTFAPTAQISSIKNDADYAAIVAKTVSPLAAPTTSIKAKAASLTANAKNEREKILALRDFVAKEIRAAGPSFNTLPLSCLSAADTTLDDRYGNSADRAILLQALLDAAGIKSKLILVANDPQTHLREKGAPLQRDFYHTLVVRISLGGKFLYLDQLSQYADLDTTALNGDTALPLDGSPAFVVKVEPSFRSREISHYDIKIAANGDALITYTQHFNGDEFTGFKKQFTEFTPEDRSRIFQQMLANLSQDAVATSKLSTDFAYPGTLKFQARIPRYAVVTGSDLYFDLPAAQKAIFNAHADIRQNPFYQNKKYHLAITWNIEMPVGFKIHTQPKPYRWEGPGHLGRIAITSIKPDAANLQTLAIREIIDIHRALVPVGSYATLLDANRHLSQPGTWRVLLESQVHKTNEMQSAGKTAAK